MSHLLGPEAVEKDKDLTKKVENQVQSGQRIKPPALDPDLYGSLSPWEGLMIQTVLQAHNLRHCAVTNQNVFAV